MLRMIPLLVALIALAACGDGLGAPDRAAARPDPPTPTTTTGDPDEVPVTSTAPSNAAPEPDDPTVEPEADENDQAPDRQLDAAPTPVIVGVDPSEIDALLADIDAVVADLESSLSITEQDVAP